MIYVSCLFLNSISNIFDVECYNLDYILITLHGIEDLFLNSINLHFLSFLFLLLFPDRNVRNENQSRYSTYILIIFTKNLGKHGCWEKSPTKKIQCDRKQKNIDQYFSFYIHKLYNNFGSNILAKDKP